MSDRLERPQHVRIRYEHTRQIVATVIEQELTTPSPSSIQRISCPIWHSPLLFVVPDGLLIKCKSCRKEMHHISREEIERIWDDMKQENSDLLAEKPAM